MERTPEEVAALCDPSMRIARPWTCGDCVHHRKCSALMTLTGKEQHCDFAPSRFRLDTIGTLARLVQDAGATLTLYGEPVSADELRTFARGEAENRIVRALAGEQ